MKEKGNQLFNARKFHESDLVINRNLHFAIAGLSFLIIIAIFLLQSFTNSLLVSAAFAIICMPCSFAVAWCYKQCILFGQRSSLYYFSDSSYLLFTFSLISVVSFSVSIGALIAAISISLLWLFAVISFISLGFILIFNRQFTIYLRNKHNLQWTAARRANSHRISD